MYCIWCAALRRLGISLGLTGEQVTFEFSSPKLSTIFNLLDSGIPFKGWTSKREHFQLDTVLA